MTQLYIGLISGTSIDGIDTVLVEFDSPKTAKLIAHHAHPITEPLKSKLHLLCHSGASNKAYNSEIDLMGVVDHQFAQLCADAVKTLCDKAQVSPQQVTAIGSHGQTIRHLPASEQRGFTLQIGDASTLAVLTGIDVIADFRRKDMALGGQGAPMVCGFHQAMFNDQDQPRVIVNIGGISNITYLPAANSQKQTLGYDTGPGNTLLDQWIKHHQQQEFDDSGRWARSGKLNNSLLNHLLDDEYFLLPSPKSTGREKFNLQWLDNKLSSFNNPAPIAAEDIQHTLVHLTAKTIADEISQHITSQDAQNKVQIYVCGGGAHNPFILETLQQYLTNGIVNITDDLGIQADYVEAMAFAWLAHAYCNQLPGNVPSVTGASKATVLGAMYRHF